MLNVCCAVISLVCFTNAFSVDSEVIFENAQCEKDLELYWNDLKQFKAWTLPFLDASAKLPAGITTGNLVDMGNYDECLGITHEISPNRIIKGKFCMVKITLPPGLLGRSTKDDMERMVADPSGIPGLNLAACVPNSCSPKDIQTVYNRIYKGYKYVWDSIVGGLFPAAKMLNVTVFDFTCATADDVVQWEYGDIITVIFLGIIAYSVVMCTAYDVYIRQKGEKPRHKALLAFSVYTNGVKLMSTTPNADQLSCLHGIGFISMMWVIIGHKYLMEMSSPLLNLADMVPWIMKVSNMFIIGAPVSVDSFFVLSGLLVVYVSLKAMDKGIKFNIPLYYLHRYIRLTPVLAVVILIHVTIFKFFGNGPYWNLAYVGWKQGCVDYWWSALLYVQNYVNPNNMCIGQSWYLSVDTQLFVLSPLIILPMWYWKHKSMWWNGLLVLGSIAIDFAVSYIYKLSGLDVGGDTETAQVYMDKYYVPLQTRYGPWLIGAILGYFIFQIKTKRIKNIELNKMIIWSGWIIALLTMAAVVWAPHNLLEHEYNRLESSLFNAFHRQAWALALCWVIFACTQGYGGIVNWFLSLPVFQVLGRFTYSMYILHFSIMIAKLGRVKSTQNFSQFDTMQDFWGELMMTLFMSVILTLTFESPMIIIEKVLFGSEKRKPQKEILGNVTTLEQIYKKD